MKPILALFILLLSTAHAAEPLPFDRETISRLSLDGKPRSLAIKQGSDVWLGYDLERATVFKAWQAKEGKPGIIKTEFVTKSAGTALFEDKSDTPWELQRNGKAVPLTIRYLGCTQRKDHIELRWELKHDQGQLTLLERVPLSAAPTADRIMRELHVESLAKGESLLPPPAVRSSWKWTTSPQLTGTQWHRLTLP